ncbi:MAG: type II toxin-antitoxin system VapC family toxin [Anaerolineales bacterium]|nr:type II toxin-antitoxin system VapC family toxin [Anaerolineales bacterium]
MKKSRVCVDASLVMALLTPERFSQMALALWQEWALDDREIVAPLLLRYEVTSALYRKALQNSISKEDAAQALQYFLALDIEFMDPPDLPVLATELANKFQRPNTYDAHYLALAQRLDCQFWTGDERLYNATQGSFEWICWIESDPSGP